MIPSENRLLKRIQVMLSKIKITSSQISDSTPTGRAVLTIADAAAARSAIGAGTSNFSGAMSEVTGLTAALASKVNTSALSAYLTAAAASSTYYPLTNPNGYITSGALSPYLTTATAASTYVPLASLANYTATAALTTLLAAKADASSVKRTETYIGTTDTNGLFTVTYATAFATRPGVQPEPPTNPKQAWVVVSSTASGFSLRLVQRSAVTLLAVEVLLATETNVSGAAARVVVIAQ